jgi:HlyD family secretion protein
MTQHYWLPVWLLSALIAGCGPGYGTSASARPSSTKADSGEAGASPLVKVTPIQPQRKTLVRWTEQPGAIEAYQETPLFAKLAAFVEKMHVDIGDAVTGPKVDDQGHIIREAQLLVELSVPELDEELQQKQAAIGQAQAEIQQASAGIKVARAAEVSARARVEESEAVVDQTQADYEFAESEFARLEKLADRGAVTREVAEEKQKLLRAADSVRKQTQARIAAARAAVAEKHAQVEKAEADFEAAQKKLLVAEADLARVKAMLAYTRILAPYDGIVAARNVHTGHLVQPGVGSGGKPLLVVVQIAIMRIFVDVPESDAPLISDGSEAEVQFPSGMVEPRKGTVTRTTWILNAGSRTLRTEVDLDNADQKLRPGMYAHARIKVAERVNALSLPRGAVLGSGADTYCLTIDSDGLINRTSVAAGIRTGDDVEIVSGLTGDEQVIGVNAAAFHEGQQVETTVASAAAR